MDIDIVIGSKLLGVSEQTARKALRRVGCPSRALGVKNHVWGARHVCGLLTASALVGRGVTVDVSESVGRAIGGFPSDEQLEAALANGRRWVMLTPPHALPELLFAENIRSAGAEKGAALAAIGLRIEALDVGPLFQDVCARVRAMKADREGATNG